MFRYINAVQWNSTLTELTTETIGLLSLDVLAANLTRQLRLFIQENISYMFSMFPIKVYYNVYSLY